jgi:hypothetical protein
MIAKDRSKQGPTPKAPQNRKGNGQPISAEQQEMIDRISVAAHALYGCLVGMPVNEALSALKTTEGMIQTQMQATIEKTLIQPRIEPGGEGV